MFNSELDLESVVRVLRGGAEPTRLRLLCLLQHGELTVGELCQILDQSQPRISRHLRLLVEAGLLDRFREQQCVYYRPPSQGPGLEWSRQMLALINPRSATLELDRERAARLVAARTLLPLPEPPAPDLSQVLHEELGPASVGELLDIGTGEGALIAILGPRAHHAVGLDISPPALRAARSRIRSAGLAHCEFRHGDMYQLPFEDQHFDTVVVDQVLARCERPEAALSEAARVVRSGGRLLVLDEFDALDARARQRTAAIGGAQSTPSGNGITQLQRWMSGAGLNVSRLRPCDLLAGHVVLAVGARA